MANRERGEASIDIDGKPYTMVLSLNAMAAVEELFSEPGKEVTFEQVSNRADAGSIRHVRGLIWGVLQDHHPELTVENVGLLVQRAGGLGVFTLKLAELAASAAPDERDLKRLGVKKKPRA